MSEYLEWNKQTYDQAADKYRSRLSPESSYYQFTNKAFELIESFRAKKHPKYLEIGPGAGQATKLFADAGYDTVAVDISPKMLRIVKEKSPKTKVILGNILEVEMPEVVKFDVIYSEMSIHCIPKDDAEKLLIKLAAWLEQPNGLFYVTTSVEKESSEGLEEKRAEKYGESAVRYRAKYTEQEFSQLLARHFEIVKAGIYDDRGKDMVQAYLCKSATVVGREGLEPPTSSV